MKQIQNTNSPRVFISYAVEDEAHARRLYNDLQRNCVNVFAAFASIVPGESLPERINKALEWCDTLVLLWSKHTANSSWVSAEWQTAFCLNRRIVPFVIDDTALPSILSFRLHLAFSNYDEEYFKLCKALGVTLIKENPLTST